MKWILCIIGLATLLTITACNKPLNNPHSVNNSINANIFYGSFTESPKTLDPAKSYSVDETLFIAQIYEPPLQYHYLLRPYTLVPLTAQNMPTVHYWNKQNQILPDDVSADQIGYSTYDIHIKPGIFYQPHPAFSQLRELVADDYIYEIKRLAAPNVNSPILGLMSTYIVGLADYVKLLQKVQDEKKSADFFLDLRQYPLAGAQRIDKYTYRIQLKGKYPGFMYWLAMPFFAPIPWEVDYYYSRPGMKEKNIGFDWYPVGTGPYLLKENNPNLRMVLVRNPNFHGELYPSQGMPGDEAAGLLLNAGQRLPFVDQFVFDLEKESIPRWNKFLQGYYDQSAISPDNFDQAIQIDARGNPQLTPSMREKGIQLSTSVAPKIYYFGFNMLDKIVGGNDESAAKLRRAISIAIDFEEYINIFLNGRGLVAQGPIPPGVFGYVPGEAGINPFVYEWRNGTAQRKSLQSAQQLLAEAGYPNGVHAQTGKPLLLNYDAIATSAPDAKSQFDWFRKQFMKLNIELNIRNTQYNRFQEKLRNGSFQTFLFGWIADYPDPENFLFLLYGPNSKVKYGGENAVNYANPQYDRLFETMRNLPNSMQRQQIINQMVDILRKDAPWDWGFYSKDFLLTQKWVNPIKPNALIYNSYKYVKLNPALRTQLQMQWNQPVLWPLLLLLLALILLILPAVVSYWRRIYKPRKR